MLFHFRWLQVRQIDTPSQNNLTSSWSLNWISYRFRGRDFLVEPTKAMLQTQSKFVPIQPLLFPRKSSCQLITVSDIPKLVAFQDHWCRISAVLKRRGTGSNKTEVFTLNLNLRNRLKASLMKLDLVNRSRAKASVLKFRRKRWKRSKTTFRKISYKITVTIFKD